MISDLSHWFNNLLSIVLSYSELLAEDLKWRAVSRSADFAEPYPVEFPPDTAD